jgi:hypothetical protein
MGSIPDQDPLVRQIKETAHAVAYRKCLPWDLSTLREAGYWAAREARDEYLTEKEALGNPSFEQYAQRAIEEAMLATAERLRAEAAAGEKVPPSKSDIEEALKEFTAKEWRDLNPKETREQRKARMEWTGLCRSLSRADLDAVGSYVYGEAQMMPDERKQREKELEQRFGAKEVNAFLLGIIMRDTELFAADEDERSKLVPVNDAYWAVRWEYLFRHANISHANPEGRRSNVGSLDELAGVRATARRLTKRDEVAGCEMKVTPYMVKQWRQRIRQLPFEEFDSDWVSYLKTIYFTKAYKSYQRAKGRNDK